MSAMFKEIFFHLPHGVPIFRKGLSVRFRHSYTEKCLFPCLETSFPVLLRIII